MQAEPDVRLFEFPTGGARALLLSLQQFRRLIEAQIDERHLVLHRPFDGLLERQLLVDVDADAVK